MKSGYIQRATVEDAIYIASNLREADRMECDALLACPPIMVVPHAVQQGRDVWTFHAPDGEPIGVFGVDPVVGQSLVGTVWMCSTPVVLKHKTEFLRGCGPILDQVLHYNYPILTNLVDARNTLHHRWLRWLGFSFLNRVEKWGARSLPFYEFARMKTCA